MTVGEYLTSLFTGISIPEAFLVDTGLDLEQDYSPDLPIGEQVVGLAGSIINMVSLKSVSENGFSMSWDTGRLGKFYLWLCRKYGIKPDGELLADLGISSIIDISDTW